MKKISIVAVAAALAFGVAAGTSHADQYERFATREAALADAYSSVKRTAKAFGATMPNAFVCAPSSSGGGGIATIAFTSSLSLPRDVSAVELYPLDGGFAWRRADPARLKNCVFSTGDLK